MTELQLRLYDTDQEYQNSLNKINEQKEII